MCIYRKEDVLQAIEQIDFSRGRTNTADALRMMRSQMFSRASGDRSDVPNFAIVITDGQSNINKRNTIPEAVESRIEGVHVMAVTVLPDDPSLEIKGIASDPDSYNMFNVNKFSDLGTMTDRLIDAMCDGKVELK